MKSQESLIRQWYPHVTVASLAVRDGKYLMVEEFHQGKCVLNQPAGHLERDETLEEAVIRETREETGWSFQPDYLTGIYCFVADNGETYIRFTFFGTLLDHDPGLRLDPAIKSVNWLGLAELEAMRGRLRSQAVLKCIQDFESGNRLSENAVQQLE